MSRVLLKNIIRFILFVLLQVLVINHVHLGSFITPFIYILVILLLPFNLERAWLLLIGFALGFAVDIFSGTLGTHAAACTLLAFLRPLILKIVLSTHEVNPKAEPNMNTLGIPNFLLYVSLMVLIFQFVYVFLEVFDFRDLLHSLLQIFCSSIVSILFIFAEQYLFNNTKD